MFKLDLNGNWILQRPKTGETWPAIVPGCVHADLLRNEAIEDMFWRDNEANQQWIAEENWNWSRSFKLTQENISEHSDLFLNCAGLDTLAEISINGKRVFSADNMFREWNIPISNFLQVGENSISITCFSPIPYLEEKNQKFRLPTWNVYDSRYQGRSWLRKMPCSFGWDWGLKAVTCGIWKSISITSKPKFNHKFAVEQTIATDYSSAKLTFPLSDSPQNWEIELSHPNGKTKLFRRENTKAPEIEISSPELWWPNGMGAQALYSVKISLLNSHGEIIESASTKFGIRKIELRRQADEWGESFEFLVNSLPIFAKGANWIPCNILVSEIKETDYQKWLNAAADAHMNILRVWGGGIYEHDAFYEICDELGILIWQDFMFSCSTYPAFDKEFLENVAQEAQDNIIRLRNHPCLALWCGNNEIEQGLADKTWTNDSMSWQDYATLFENLLPRLVSQFSPSIPYWPGSPHTPHGDRTNWNDPTCGDAHCWDVWFGGESFEFQRQWKHRFMSEFGFQSFPELKTLASFTLPDEQNLTSYIVDYHQRSPNGNRKIFAYLMDWFQLPKNLEETLWLTQITQAACIQYACEHARRTQPRMMGVIYWQINDLWPCASWSSIDSFGRWKALHHSARRFFAPVLLSLVESSENGTMEIHVSNHLPTDFFAKINWILSDLEGNKIKSGKLSANISSQSNLLVETITCLEQNAQNSPEEAYLRDKKFHDLIFFAELENPPSNQSSSPLAVQFFTRPKYLNLTQPTWEISEITSKDSLHWTLKISASKPALFCRVELANEEIKLSDNFFAIHPEFPLHLSLTTNHPVSAEYLTQNLRISSLIDSYSINEKQDRNCHHGKR